MKALSIRQPFAWLIVNGCKDVENRTWSTSYRGPLLICASKTLDPHFEEIRTEMREDYGVEIPDAQHIERGGIVGQATLSDCVTEDESTWFVGPYGFILEDTGPLPFQPVKGRLGLFDVEL